jgi:hypothetical protein
MKMNTIKLIMLSFLVSFFTFENTFAQKDGKSDKNEKSENTYVSADAKLTKIHSKEELEKLGKIELTEIYKQRISIISEIIPYLALHPKPGATLKEMGIPQTSENSSHLEKEVKNKAAYINSVNETLDDIIPYADKSNIIWSILFFERVIQEADYTNNSK